MRGVALAAAFSALATPAQAQTTIGTFGPDLVQRPQPADSGFSNVGLYYEISGRGQNWVVLIHGFGVDERMWNEQMAVLNSMFRVLRYDLEAHGRSPAPPQPRPAWRDLQLLMDQLQISSAALVGLSAGSRVASDFAVVSPERVQRLVLVSPSIGGYVPKEDMMSWFAPIVAQARAGRPDSAAALFAETKLVKLYGDTAKQRWLTKLIRENAQVWRDTLRAVPLTPPALDRLGVVRSPVLVIVGAHDSPDTRAVAESVVAKVPRGKLVVFPDAGHVVNIDQPAKFDSVLVHFLIGAP